MQDARTESPEFIIVAEQLIDGHRDAYPLSDVAVLVTAGRVLAIEPRRGLGERWPGVPVHDYASATVMPGLIDCHVHLTFPGDGSLFEGPAQASRDVRHARADANGRAHLCQGVTTVRDVGSHADLLGWRQGKGLDYPRILAYGPPLTRPRGHMYLFGGECQGGEEVRRRVVENVHLGADGIKITASGGGTLGTKWNEASFNREELSEAVTVAHELGKLTTAHTLASESVARALDAGVDGIEHVGFLDAEERSHVDTRLADRLVEQQIAIGATLAVNFRYIGMAERGEVPSHELEEQRVRSENFRRNAATLYRMGARFVAASDAGWKYTPFGDLVLELERMEAAEMPTRDVIHAATAGAAGYLRLDRIGRVAAGFTADLVVVDGNPLSDLQDLRRIQAVYREGKKVVAR